jgi:hypothetical protein
VAVPESKLAATPPMGALVSWLVFPAVLALLCAGCGILAYRIAGLRVAPELVLPLGYAVIIVVTGFAVWLPGPADLATPVVAGLAAVGLLLLVSRLRLLRPRVWLWAAAAATVVFLAYGAPVLASGSPTFAGYITLDDSATWFALVDRALESGRSLEGLPPSSYEATLDSYLMTGYPLGALLPLGVSAQLTGQDVAWVYQPYLAFLAGLLALVLFALTRRLVDRPWAASLLATIAAQPALLYAYAQWTGVKEVAAAGLIPLCCAFGGASTSSRRRTAIPVAIGVAALLGVLTLGGLAWVAGAAAIGAVLVARKRDWGLLGATGALTLGLSIPVLATARPFLDQGADVLTSGDELGNLPGPLDPLQLGGIWPSSDFRYEPGHRGQTLFLVGLVIVLAGAGVLFTVRRQAWTVLAYVATALVGVSAIAAFGSPWVDGKAFATASPAVLLAAVLGCAWLWASGRRTAAGLLTALVAGGVLWSNVLAYTGVSLAPHDQLAELEAVGERFAGQGPALMTEYQPYGVRHFLRRLDPEGTSELRRRPVPRRDGSLVPKGASADLDELRLDGVLVYRTVVLRHSPLASRPPAPYKLVWEGEWYEVWQRPATFEPIVTHLPLGDASRPGGVPSCPAVERLAAGASLVLAAPADDPVAVEQPPLEGRRLAFEIRRGGRYALWLGGSRRDGAVLLVDGRIVARGGPHLETAGQLTELGTVVLLPGQHAAEVRFDPSRFRPGARGPDFGSGPLVVAPASRRRALLVRAPAAARSLCGRTLDWLEARG